MLTNRSRPIASPSFSATRRVEAWAGDRKVADLTVGVQRASFTLKGLRLDRKGEKLDIRLHADGASAKVVDDQGGTREATVAFHDFRVISRH